MWERRYGYPKPSRDSNGDRVCSEGQLDRLIAILQLVEQGNRPGKLMTLDLPQLRSVYRAPKVALDMVHITELLEAGDIVALRSMFQERLVALGLRAFVHKVSRTVSAF
jgi:hypothetical protein